MTIERIDIVITEKGGKVVKRSLDDIAASSKVVEKDLSKLNKTALIVGGAIGTVLGGAAVMLAKGLNKAAKDMADTYDAAKKLGTTTEVLSRLEFAARTYGMTTDQVRGSVESLQAAQERAAKGMGGMGKLFAQLGIDAVTNTGALRDTNLVLNDLADRFAKMPDDVNKARLAAKLFGNENRQMVQVLSEGSAGLAELSKKSDEFGYTVGTKTAKDLDAFYDELDLVKLKIEGIYRQAIPGLLPYLKQFSALLNSQEFKDGFNAIVQGAAQAIIWLAKLATTVANVTSFIGQEVAARMGHTVAEDTVRVEQRIERLQDTMKALEKPGVLGLGIMSAKELKPSDFLKPIDEVKMRIQGELDKEKNKLELGVRMNAETAAKAAKLGDLTAPPVGEVPDIDWTKLGRGGGGGAKAKKDNSAEKAARELEALQRELNSLLGSINPVLAAQQDLTSAQDTFNKSVEKGLITQQEATKYMAIYEESLKDQLDPLGAINRELNEQIKVAGMLNEERQVESQMLQITEELKRSGVQATEAETAALREQLKTLQEVDKLAAAKENILAGSTGKRDEQQKIDLTALDALKGQLSDTDTFNVLNQMLGGSLDETQSAFDARIEQFRNYYDIIEQFRQQDVANETLASEAKTAIKQQEMEMYLSATSQGLGEVKKLMGSHNKTAFKIGQAAAIAQVAIDTPTAAMAAFKSMQGIPYVGPVLGAAAAAAAVVYGMQQISAIRSQQMPAYRTGGSMVVGGSGGTDSQTVALRATPGERISVNTPAQARALERLGRQEGEGGGRVFNSNVTIVQQGRADRKTSEHQARQVRIQQQKEFERNN